MDKEAQEKPDEKEDNKKEVKNTNGIIGLVLSLLSVVLFFFGNNSFSVFLYGSGLFALVGIIFSIIQLSKKKKIVSFLGLIIGIFLIMLLVWMFLQGNYQ